MKRLYITILFSLFCLPSISTANDPAIKNAQIDIVRFEKQANGLTPARSSNAKRILKLLNLSHQRLLQSSHQNEPSWIEMNQRYLSLQTQLELIISPSKPLKKQLTLLKTTPLNLK